MRLIDADALLREASKTLWWETGDTWLIVSMANQIQNAPTIEPVKHGHWVKKRRRIGDIHKETGYVDFDNGVGVGELITIKVDGRTEYVEMYCSECGAVCSDSWNNFCGRCGAKMDGDVNEPD